MKANFMLMVSSLLSIFFMTLHVTDDILRNQNGVAEGGFLNVIVVLILLVWLYGTLVLTERRSGYIISLVGSLFATYVAVGHLTGIGDVVVGEIAKTSGAPFVWVVVALGVTALFTLVLSARALWSPAKAPSPVAQPRKVAAARK